MKRLSSVFLASALALTLASSAFAKESMMMGKSSGLAHNCELLGENERRACLTKLLMQRHESKMQHHMDKMKMKTQRNMEKMGSRAGHRMNKKMVKQEEMKRKMMRSTSSPSKSSSSSH